MYIMEQYFGKQYASKHLPYGEAHRDAREEREELGMEGEDACADVQ